jgi:hypothetical protein
MLVNAFLENGRIASFVLHSTTPFFIERAMLMRWFFVVCETVCLLPCL